jgi:hypothetical protein
LDELSGSFPQLAEPLTQLDFKFRERIFSPVVTFWMFLSQVLSGGASCQEMVAKALAALLLSEGKRASPVNSAYCQARKRLPECYLQQLATSVAEQMESEVMTGRLWMGRPVKVVDGSSVSMPDTAENQQAYPQPKGQKRGCGFPVMRLVVVFSLATGVIVRLAHGCLQQSERLLFQSLRNVLQPGDVLLGDRGFCSFAEVYLFQQQGIDVVLRNNDHRQSGVRFNQKLQQGDRLIEWVRTTKKRPSWMKHSTWMGLPETISLREITYSIPIKGFRSKRVVLATTLTDSKRFPKEALAELYLRRWRAELFLRDIKISLHMDVLRCKTPAMIHKELWMHIIAYNLIRSLMWEAAKRDQIRVLSMSFKGSVAMVRQWAPWMAVLQSTAMHKVLLDYLAQQLVPSRPNRVEPRVRKRRPKNYPLLTTHRRLFKELPHRNRYRKDS